MYLHKTSQCFVGKTCAIANFVQNNGPFVAISGIIVPFFGAALLKDIKVSVIHQIRIPGPDFVSILSLD